MTDRERAVGVLRALRDEYAYDSAMSYVLGTAIELLQLPAAVIWQFEDAVEDAVELEQLTAEGAGPPTPSQAAPPVKLGSFAGGG